MNLCATPSAVTARPASPDGGDQERFWPNLAPKPAALKKGLNGCPIYQRRAPDANPHNPRTAGRMIVGAPARPRQGRIAGTYRRPPVYTRCAVNAGWRPQSYQDGAGIRIIVGTPPEMWQARITRSRHLRMSGRRRVRTAFQHPDRPPGNTFRRLPEQDHHRRMHDRPLPGEHRPRTAALPPSQDGRGGALAVRGIRAERDTPSEPNPATWNGRIRACDQRAGTPAADGTGWYGGRHPGRQARTARATSPRSPRSAWHGLPGHAPPGARARMFTGEGAITANRAIPGRGLDFDR